MEWQSKRILVTGGSSGIGKQLVKALSKKSAQVFFCGLENDLVAEVSSAYNVSGICCNLSREEGIDKIYSEAIGQLGEIDILVNNAGSAITGPFEDLKREDFEMMFAINAIAPARLCQKVIPGFKEKDCGDIVNIGASGRNYGFKNGSAYGPSKAALGNLSQCLAVELRPHNIRVIHIDPSWCTDTIHGMSGKIERNEKLLTAEDVALSIISALELPHRAFIPQMSIWATNPNPH